LLIALVAGCVVEGPVGGNRGASSEQHAKVPPGHLPPPGQCRIWYADRPPGKQPPPGDCRELRARVPPGATLVRG
jgi:hypothetical protein